MAFLAPIVYRELSGRGRNWRRAALLAFVLLLAAGVRLSAQPIPSREYQIKAAFLFNFAQFVDWPAKAFGGADEPIRIGILGDDPFGPALDKVIRGEVVHHRRLVVVRSNRLADLENCQVVFVSRSEEGRLEEIITRLSGKAILTVSEIPGFAEQGGIIRLTLAGGKVRFEINPAAGKQEGLKLSSQLLSVGKIVAGRKGSG